MTILGDRLKQARKNNSLSQEDAAAQMGISPISISNYERGVRKPNVKNLQKLSNLYQVPTDWLLDEKETNIEKTDPERDPMQAFLQAISDVLSVQGSDVKLQYVKKKAGKIVNKTSSVPLIRNINNLSTLYEKSNIEEYILIDAVIFEKGTDDEVFFWQVTSSNMSPSIIPGDLVLIKRQKGVNDGGVGVFIYNNEVSIHIVHRSNGTVIFNNINPEYPPVTLKSSETTLVGEVILSQRYYRKSKH